MSIRSGHACLTLIDISSRGKREMLNRPVNDTYICLGISMFPLHPPVFSNVIRMIRSTFSDVRSIYVDHRGAYYVCVSSNDGDHRGAYYVCVSSNDGDHRGAYYVCVSSNDGDHRGAYYVCVSSNDDDHRGAYYVCVSSNDDDHRGAYYVCVSSNDGDYHGAYYVCVSSNDDDHGGVYLVCLSSNDRIQTAECHVWLYLAVFECHLLYVVHASTVHLLTGGTTSTDQREIDLASFVQ